MIFVLCELVRCAAPLPPRSFGARRPPLGQGEVIGSGWLETIFAA
jgi:hypothetical protein